MVEIDIKAAACVVAALSVFSVPASAERAHGFVWLVSGKTDKIVVAAVGPACSSVQ
ncbi:MAG: hypothetical protein IJQ65_01435 [Kiritimatiellae bacterium]|nr:hypothetical protein [Kiritimatiellia bacterium]